MLHMKEPQAAISRVLSFIKGDLEEIALPKDRRPRSSFPAILTCFSGMDFLGALISGNKGNHAKERVQAFLKGPMAKIDPRYSEIAADLYSMLRKPLVHCGTMAGYFLIDSDISFRDQHLMRVIRDDREYVALHTATFVQHFLAAAELTQGDLLNRPHPNELTDILNVILPDLYKRPPESIPAQPLVSRLTTLPLCHLGSAPLSTNTKGTCQDDTPRW
jgi:hypothetical protein